MAHHRTPLEFWNDFALKGYDDVAGIPGYRRLVKQVLDNLANCNKVLDVGCGTGNLAIELAKQGKTVFGIDNSKNMLIQIKNKLQNMDIKVALSREDAAKLRFKDNFFDAVCCINVLFNFKNPEPVIKEAYRVLAKNGIFIVSGPKNGAKITKELKEKVLNECNKEGSNLDKINKIFDFNVILFNEVGMKFVPTTGQMKQLLLKNKFEIIFAGDAYYGTNYFIIGRK